MRRYHQDDPTEMLWREKLDACVSPTEAIATLLLVAVLVVSLLVR